MKIHCPTCKSEYDFPEDRLKPEGTRVRCSACSSVFLVRPRTEKAPPAASASQPVASAGAPAAADDDDLSAFFGGPPPSDSAGTAEDELDGLFGAADDGDDLFGGGDDLFSEKSAEAEDDLFGAPSDLFSDAPSAPASPPAAPAGPAPEAAPADVGAAPASAEDDLNALFEDSDVNNEAPAAPSPAAAPAASSVPNFDWDDDSADEADDASDEPEDDEDLIEYGEAGFTPAIREDDAREVLERTIVRDDAVREGSARPRVGLILFIVFAILIGAAAAVAVLQPEMIRYVMIELGLRQPEAPRIAETPIHLSGEPETTIVQNRNGFDVLVVSGTLRNDDQQPHSFVMLRVDLVAEKSGEKVTSATVYAGNDLSQLQLRNFPADEMKRLLAVEMGEDLRNFNIAPGATVPFMAVFIPAPADYLDLEPRIVVLNSVAGEQ
ncbi:MAG: hypothetical protein D6761_02150 [Candidatus Dadabacteria bacterium]|nr:MAG: hypothetical protein D6761_02150 [Candidatus Dadabacteria bacterium]